MEAKAVLRGIRISPQKVRLVVDVVRGKPVDMALAILRNMPQKAATEVARTIKSAAANAENNLKMSPEDLVVMKAIATSEDTPRYWYDAVAIIAQTELDWDYLVTRAKQHGARRVLSLLLFADSLDLVVPPGPVETLFDAITRRSS